MAALVAATLLLAVAGPAAGNQARLYSGASFGPDGAGGSETFVGPESIAVDSISGDVLVYDIGAGKVYKFDRGGHPLTFAALGTNIIEGVGGAGSGAENQIAIAPAGAPGGTEGDIYVANNASSGLQVYGADGIHLGEVETGGETCGVATDPAGHLFVGVFPAVVEFVPTANPPTGPPSRTSTVAERTCNVGVDALDNVYEVAFSGGVYRLEGIEAPAARAIDPAGYTIAVDPTDDGLLVDRGDKVVVYDADGDRVYAFGEGDLSESFGVALDPSGEAVYVGDGASGRVKVFGPAQTVPATEPATGVRSASASLHGTLDPEGRQYTACVFEYGLVADPGFEDAAECEPDAATIPPDSSTHPVHISLDDLRPDADYKFRLSATNALGTLSGQVLTFSTVGAPRLPEVLAHDADQHSATLEAVIDPRGADTSYRIEWGPTAGYGRVGASGRIAGEDGPTAVSTHIDGLVPATAYHYRVVAESEEGGETVGSDQVFETLDGCGMTDRRCFEVVSRVDRGALAKPGKIMTGAAQPQFQAAPAGSALAYTVELGYPEATTGDEAVYLARRGEAGWTSEQVTPPTLVPPKLLGGPQNSAVKVLSDDLGCAVVASAAPLVEGAPETVVEAGGTNLYRRDDATGSYQLITTLPPVGPPTPQVSYSGILGHSEYQVVGMSPDCRRVVFRTWFRYPGLRNSGGLFQLYEWDRGAIRNVAIIPGPGGSAEPVAAESVPGALPQNPDGMVPPIGEKDTTDYWRAVSVDGSHTVFTAVSRFGGDDGKLAVFLSDADDPSLAAGAVPAVDASQSETATPNDGNSRYWIASADGTRVFFTARYGLATNGSSSGATGCFNAPAGTPGDISGAGCDLYEYDARAPVGERLSDLSPDVVDAHGAGVVGVLATSADGRYVYFAARGRLGGSGRTEAENLDSGSYNVFLAHAGSIRFVGSITEEATEAGRERSGALVSTSAGGWTSQATPDGTTFVFESSVGVPADVRTVYLFSAADGRTICVSCRRDGRPPFSAKELKPLIDMSVLNREQPIAKPTVLTDDGRRVYFYSFDPLAAGAVEGRRNLYQWAAGQVSLIATEPAGVPDGGTLGNGRPFANFFGGASADGDDVYFATPQALLPGDRDEGWDVYDARVDGGLPEPPAPASPCDAAREGACNAGAVVSPAPTSVATSSFAGPANPKARRCPKERVRRQGRCVRKAHHMKHRKKAHGHKHPAGHRKAGK